MSFEDSISPKATTKITQWRGLSTKPTKEIRQHHKKCSLNFKEIRKEEKGNKEQMGQITSKYDVIDKTKLYY